MKKEIVVSETNWEKVREVLLDGKMDSVRVPTAEELRTLHAFHGWEVIGALMDVLNKEDKLQRLVLAGVPFEEATKMMGFRGVPRDVVAVIDDVVATGSKAKKEPSKNDVIRKVFFIRADDPEARTLVAAANCEIREWLKAGYGFDIVLERRDDLVDEKERM